ncbi:armadillo-type protein [Dipodascopsis uninucleata]
MNWQPQAEYLEQLRIVFAQSLSADNALRGNATHTLEEARRQHSDLNNYLVHIFVNPTTDSEIHLRASAGLMLKNNVLTQYDTPVFSSDVLAYVKEHVVLGLTQPISIIRGIAGSIVSALVAKGGFKNWPEILPKLMSMAEINSPVVQEGALGALSKLFEDSAQQLDSDPDGQQALSFMMPKFLELARAGSPRVRSQSIQCLNHFILRMSQSLFAHIDTFLATLFSLAYDVDPDVRRNICTAFVMLLDVREDKLLPHLQGIVDYTLHCMGDEDEQVALEACEFLLGLAEHEKLAPQVIAFLPKIIPVLLRCMVYSEMDIMIYNGRNEDDAEMADKLSDIKPTHAKSRKHQAASNANAREDSKSSGNGNHMNGDADDEGDEDDNDDDDLGIDLSDWNLRKCSAAALDILASNYREKILEYTIPSLREKIVSPEWPVREAAILAYGAIAEGCVEGLSSFWPEVSPFFIQSLSDPMAPVRQISCWTLGRYGNWICFRSAEIGYEREFIPVLQGLLKCCLDNNKKVQEAGCSGFANFTEQAGGLLIPYLVHILRTFTLCFQKYQTKNLTILYDAVQTLVDKVGYAMGSKEYIDLLLPPLIEKWQGLEDDNTDLFPLLECLSSVTASLGEQFAPFAPPVFQRAMTILHKNLIQDQNASQDPAVEAPDKDFIVTTLDLLDGLVQGLGVHATELINACEFPLLEMVLVCMRDPVNEVRQSAFALIGDMAINTFQCLKPYIPSIMAELIQHVDSGDPSCSAVCNNATWAAGEIALQMGAEMRPFVPALVPKLIELLVRCEQLEQTILENAGITIGRLGLSCPELIAPNLEMFSAPWCQALRIIGDTGEKETAFMGMCKIVAANPTGLNHTLDKFVEAIGLYEEPTPELIHMFHTILQGYKGMLSNNWEMQVMSKLQPDLRQLLAQRYNV